MRLLADQDIYAITISKLRHWGHDIITARELGLQRASDEDLLGKAKELNRILISRDKDFGHLVFLDKELSTGVILLRVTPMTVELVHRELSQLLEEHTEEELKKVFCVLEPHRHRIRHISVDR